MEYISNHNLLLNLVLLARSAVRCHMSNLSATFKPKLIGGQLRHCRKERGGGAGGKSVPPPHNLGWSKYCQEFFVQNNFAQECTTRG